MKNYRRSRSIKKSKRVDKICPKADYCKNADRCDYEHTFVGEKLCFERKEYETSIKDIGLSIILSIEGVHGLLIGCRFQECLRRNK